MDQASIDAFLLENCPLLGHSAKRHFSKWLRGVVADAPVSSNLPSHNLPFQRWYRFKEAFSPLLVAEALRPLGFWPKSCVDCFGGSGTTALTCQFLGIEPTTVEVNPFLADLIEAKLSQYEAEGLIADFANVFHQTTETRVDLRSVRYNAWPATMVEPGVNGRWLFPKETFRCILGLRQAIEAVEDQTNQRLLRVLLGSILVDVSNVVISGKGRRYRGGWETSQKTPRDVLGAFRDAFNDAIVDITAFGKRAMPAYTLKRGDARAALADISPVDVALFSPPYPNSFDYTDIYNIELWVLGYLRTKQDNMNLRKSTLRSHVQISRDMSWDELNSPLLSSTIAQLRKVADQLWDPNLPDMVGAYFADLDQVLRGLRPKLNSGGAALLTVGDSRYAGILIDVAGILSELAPKAGYLCEEVVPIRAMKTSAQQGWVASLSEDLVRLRAA